MSRGSSSLGGGGFSSGSSSGSYSGSHTSHSGGSGLLSGIIIGSLLSRRSGGGSSGSTGDGGDGPRYRRVRNQKATLIVSGVLLALTILFIVLSVVFRFDAVYGKVYGTYVGNEYKDGYYYSSYTYTVNGVNYNRQSKVGWTQLEPIDAELYYKKSDPNVIYETEAKSDMSSTNFFYIFFAVVFGFATFVVYASGISKLEIDPAYQEEMRKQAEEKQMEGKRKCAYCGTIMDAKENKCPNCGASQK